MKTYVGFLCNEFIRPQEAPGRDLKLALPEGVYAFWFYNKDEKGALINESSTYFLAKALMTREELIKYENQAPHILKLRLEAMEAKNATHIILTVDNRFVIPGDDSARIYINPQREIIWPLDEAERSKQLRETAVQEKQSDRARQLRKIAPKPILGKK